MPLYSLIQRLLLGNDMIYVVKFENGGANALPEHVQVSTPLAPTFKETDSITTTYFPYD
jgi:hypothetical protein